VRSPPAWLLVKMHSQAKKMISEYAYQDVQYATSSDGTARQEGDERTRFGHHKLRKRSNKRRRITSIDPSAGGAARRRRVGGRVQGLARPSIDPSARSLLPRRVGGRVN
jgi:hypothetical protein